MLDIHFIPPGHSFSGQKTLKKLLFRIRRIFGEIHQFKQIFTIERKEVFYKILEKRKKVVCCPCNTETDSEKLIVNYTEIQVYNQENR
ncbi:hypothetical protein CVH06_16740 [Escherichia coli]|nr:hypothetical protein CVH06_16740 [Escherichia coli]